MRRCGWPRCPPSGDARWRRRLKKARSTLMHLLLPTTIRPVGALHQRRDSLTHLVTLHLHLRCTTPTSIRMVNPAKQERPYHLQVRNFRRAVLGSRTAELTFLRSGYSRSSRYQGGVQGHHCTAVELRSDTRVPHLGRGFPRHHRHLLPRARTRSSLTPSPITCWTARYQPQLSPRATTTSLRPRRCSGSSASLQHVAPSLGAPASSARAQSRPHSYGST